MTLFLLTFIISNLVLLIYTRKRYPVLFLYLSPTALNFALLSTFDFSQSFFPFCSKIYSAQYVRHFLLHSFFLLRLCFLSEFSEPRRREPELSQYFFVAIHLCTFFCLPYYIRFWFYVFAVCLSVGLYWHRTCVVCVCAHLFPEV